MGRYLKQTGAKKTPQKENTSDEICPVNRNKMVTIVVVSPALQHGYQ